MSSKKTPNLELHEWVPDDYVQMEEFNENFRKLDENVGGLANISEEVNLKVEEVTTQLDEKTDFGRVVLSQFKQRSIAHRGYSDMYPENSIPAFIGAAKANFWGAECDILRTSDGVWILNHDDTVDNMTDGTGLVRNMTFSQIEALTVTGGKNVEKYPNLKLATLDEYLKVCRDYNLTPIIEVKSSGLPSLSDNWSSLIALLRKYNVENSCYIMSFSYDDLVSIRKLSSVNMMLLDFAFTNSLVDRAKTLNAALSSSHSSITQNVINYARTQGVLIGCWTLDNISTFNSDLYRQLDFITSNKLSGAKI